MNTRKYIATLKRVQLVAQEQRIELGLSPGQLAELSGISRATIASVEAGRPVDPAIVVRLASVLNTVELATPHEDGAQSPSGGVVAALPAEEVAA